MSIIDEIADVTGITPFNVFVRAGGNAVEWKRYLEDRSVPTAVRARLMKWQDKLQEGQT